MDEVFEAFISARNVDPSELGFEDNFICKEEVRGAYLVIMFYHFVYLVLRWSGAKQVRGRVKEWSGS